MNNDKQPLLSIIVPIYNKEQYLEKCIDSLLSQTLSDFEVLLVNDNSTDNSLEICKSYERSDSRVVLINSKENIGVGYSRNKGIKKAKGKYLTFIDSDDFVDKDYFERMINYTISNDVDYCMASGFLIYDKNNLMKTSEITYFDTGNSDKLINDEEGIKKLKYNICSSVCGNIFLLKTIMDNGIWFISEREFLSEDVAFMMQYSQYCKKIYISHKKGYHYRYNPHSISRKYDPDRFAKLENTITQLEKMYKAICIDNIDLKLASYFWTVYEKCVNDVIKYDTGLSRKGKIRELEKINTSKITKKLLPIAYRQLNIGGLHKLLCRMLIENNYIGIYSLLKMYNFIQRKDSKIE